VIDNKVLVAGPTVEQLCLTVFGTRVHPVSGEWVGIADSFVFNLEQGCSYSYPGPPGGSGSSPLDGGEADFKPRGLWMKIWLVDPPPFDIYEDRFFEDGWVAAHVEAEPVAGPSEEGPVHIIQWVGDGAAISALPALDRALRLAGRGDFETLVTVVVAEGLLPGAGPAAARALAGFDPGVAGVGLVATEDIQGGWSVAFGFARGGAATRVISARGEMVLSHDGEQRPRKLANVLRRIESGRVSPPRLAQLATPIGARTPDFAFELSPGRAMALRHLRGRRVLVAFVQAWSTPCVAVLRRLQRIHQRLDRENAMVLAIVGGADAEQAAELRRAHAPDLRVSPDPDSAVARRYGVWVWPTLVAIDGDGLLIGTSMGADAGALTALARERRGRATGDSAEVT
jgi:peroxiredoxin